MLEFMESVGRALTSCSRRRLAAALLGSLVCSCQRELAPQDQAEPRMKASAPACATIPATPAPPPGAGTHTHAECDPNGPPTGPRFKTFPHDVLWKAAGSKAMDCGCAAANPFGYGLSKLPDGTCKTCPEPEALPTCSIAVAQAARLLSPRSFATLSSSKTQRLRAYLLLSPAVCQGGPAHSCSCNSPFGCWSTLWLTPGPVAEGAKQETKLLLSAPPATAIAKGWDGFLLPPGHLVCKGDYASLCCPFELGRPEPGLWVVASGRKALAAPIAPEDDYGGRDETTPAFDLDELCRLPGPAAPDAAP